MVRYFLQSRKHEKRPFSSPSLIPKVGDSKVPLELAMLQSLHT